MNRHLNPWLAWDGRTDRATRSSAAMVMGAALLAWLVYTAIFHFTLPLDFAAAAVGATTNVLPLVVLALVFSLSVRTWLAPLSAWLQLVGHVVFAAGFAASWYGAIIVLQAFVRVAQGEEMALVGFSGSTLSWQCFQGIVIYAAIASFSHARPRGEAAPRPAEPQRLERYLARSGDAIQPVDVRDIVSICGAQDYSEVATTSGRHLARFSLGEFEARLDPTRFMRVHRSTIVNLEHLDRAEPAGNGRFLVMMTNGDALQTSRVGARKLRALVC